MRDGSSLTNNPCNAYKSFFLRFPGSWWNLQRPWRLVRNGLREPQRPQVMFAASEPPILDGSSESICQTGRRARWDEGKLWQSPKALKTQKRCVPFIGLCFFFGGCDLVIGMRIFWIHILSTVVYIYTYVFVHVFGYMISIWSHKRLLSSFPTFVALTHMFFHTPNKVFSESSAVDVVYLQSCLMTTSLTATSKGYIEY